MSNNQVFCMQSPLGEIVMTAVNNKLTALHLATEKEKKERKEKKGKKEKKRSGVVRAAVRKSNNDLKKIIIETQDEGHQKKFSIFEKAEKQLNAYFEGKRDHFDLSLDAQGTEFQRRVWQAICKIPSGKTKSYGEVAKMINRPLAARAVGMALNKNPLAIIVPCHRVVGANGKLVGYAGGLEMKRWLLAHEAK